jgi:hypothetical protein
VLARHGDFDAIGADARAWLERERRRLVSMCLQDVTRRRRARICADAACRCDL